MLELQHIHKMYNPGTINEICLFDDFNLTIEDRTVVSVVGSNGSGKTPCLISSVEVFRWTVVRLW